MRLLEGKLGELIQFGEENDAISEKVHRLAAALLGARDFAAAAHALYFHLREDFAVPHVALRVWGKSAAGGRRRRRAPVNDELRTHVETMGAPQCGAGRRQPVPRLVRRRRRSTCARSRWCRSGQTKSFGLLALGSEDAKRFYPEMGTLYLRRIGELIAAALAARL